MFLARHEAPRATREPPDAGGTGRACRPGACRDSGRGLGWEIDADTTVLLPPGVFGAERRSRAAGAVCAARVRCRLHRRQRTRRGNATRSCAGRRPATTRNGAEPWGSCLFNSVAIRARFMPAGRPWGCERVCRDRLRRSTHGPTGRRTSSGTPTDCFMLRPTRTGFYPGTRPRRAERGRRGRDLSTRPLPAGGRRPEFREAFQTCAATGAGGFSGPTSFDDFRPGVRLRTMPDSAGVSFSSTRTHFRLGDAASCAPLAAERCRRPDWCRRWRAATTWRALAVWHRRRMFVM